MNERLSGGRSPFALVLASSLAEVFFATRYEGASAYPLREKILGLGLAQLALLALVWAGTRRPRQKEGRAYSVLLVGALSLALMRTVKEGWRFYTLYADENSGLILFGALALLVAAWGVYWGQAAALRMGPAVLGAVALMGALVLASLAGQCHLTNLPAQPIRPTGVGGAFAASFFLLPELLFWMEGAAGKPAGRGESGKYLALVWAVQSLLWVTVELIWNEGAGAGAFETARLGLLSVFRRFDILYMPVLLLLFFSRLILYTLWLARLWQGFGVDKGAALWNGGLCLLGAAFLYSGSLQKILSGGEQVLLWLAFILFLAGGMAAKEKRGA